MQAVKSPFCSSWWKLLLDESSAVSAVSPLLDNAACRKCDEELMSNPNRSGKSKFNFEMVFCTSATWILRRQKFEARKSRGNFLLARGVVGTLVNRVLVSTSSPESSA